MDYCIEAFGKYIPPQIDGYHFVQRVDAFIPYKEVGLSILERKEVQLSFVYETILRLLSENVKDINQMAMVLGLSIEIFKEIISQMAQEDLISVSELSIILTQKGKETLQDLKKIVIAKTQLNRIVTNMITGEITNSDHYNFYDRPLPTSMCLDSIIKIDIQFFRNQFNSIEKIYNKSKIDELDLDNTLGEQDSLYRILDIIYDKVKYISKSCFIYINDEDSSLLMSFEDDNSLIYASTAIQQISNNIVSAMNLFNYDLNFEFSPVNGTKDQEKALQDLISLIERRDKAIVPIEELELHYYKDRFLLDGEVRDILMNCGKFKPEKITLCSVCSNIFLQDHTLIDSLTNISPSTQISFIYSESEYRINNAVKWVKDHIKDKKVIKFHMVPFNKLIKYTMIICEPGFVINVYYLHEQDNKRHPLVRKVANISFGVEKINESNKIVSGLLDEKVIDL